MSRQVNLDCICRNCGGDFQASAFRIIWGENPSNREFVFSDEINLIKCPRCGTELRAPLGLLYVDLDKQFAVWYEPVPDPGIDSENQTFADMFGRENLYSSAPRIKDWEEFKDTICRFERGELKARPLDTTLPAAIAGLANAVEKRAIGNRSAVADHAATTVRSPTEFAKENEPRRDLFSAAVEAVFKFIFAVYMIGLVVSVPYFNWSYAKHHGFMDWLLLGEVVATSEAVIWPYYAYRGGADDDMHDKAWKEFQESLAHYIDGMRIVNSRPFDEPLSADQQSELIQKLHLAYDVGSRVSIKELDTRHEGLGRHFANEYLAGLRALINGLETGNNDEKKQGLEQIRLWVVYFGKTKDPNN